MRARPKIFTNRLPGGRTAGLLALAFTLSACGSNSTAPYQAPVVTPQEIPNKAAVPPPTALDCNSGTALTYTNFGESFLLKYCTGCHSGSVSGDARMGASGSVNFDTIAEVQTWRQEILDALNGKPKKMPPGGAVSETELKSAQKWLDCGTPNADDKKPAAY